MHIGNVRTAAFSWLLARHYNGQFILRIEDTDRTRYVDGSAEEIIDGLRWLGLDWDEGPYYQSERLEYYEKYSEELLLQGKAYRCWCSPERLTEMRDAQKAAGKPTGYDRYCREDSHGHTPDESHVIRFAMPKDGTTTFCDKVRGSLTFENALIDDFVMVKADGFPTYQFANVVDDHLMGISHVVRSEEWLSSTPKHVQLYEALGWQPPVFAHPSLILGPDKSKLSKRHGAVSFKEFTEMGYLPDALLNFMSLLGWSPGDDREVMTRHEIIEAFDLPGIVSHPAIFDMQKLEWIQRQHIRLLGDVELAGLVSPLLMEAGLTDGRDLKYVAHVCELMKERLTTLPDIVGFAGYFFSDNFTYEEKGLKWLTDPSASELFKRLIEKFQTADWAENNIEDIVRKTGAELGREGGAVIHPVRVACTGRTVGPSLFAALEALGRERVLKRLMRAAEYTGD